MNKCPFGSKSLEELGDFFEALARAVFVDSGSSYETVWRVFSPLLKLGLGK